MYIKRLLFDIFENARALFNDYYNGFNHNYTDEDIKIIKTLLNMIQEDLDELKNML